MLNEIFWRDQTPPQKMLIGNILLCACRIVFTLLQSTSIFSFFDSLDYIRESPSTTCQEVSFVATNVRISLSMKSKYNDLYYIFNDLYNIF